MSTYPHHNSRRRQFVAGILFSAAFVVPTAVGYMLSENTHIVLIVIALFFILQFSAFYVATSKLRKTDHD